ncbi:hypothetical protein ACGF7U_31130 [Micromonospora sp. NPDC047670]|uniref:hypothetical protein n=1 Tax=Micromonospora sp. NPDC047670 TaxID=3364252 RepID=UPI00371B94A6
MSISEKVAALREAAEMNDAEAARELGRLMCLVPQDPKARGQVEAFDFDVTWPAEPWLRAATSARAEDGLAKKLLAGVLIRQIAYWQSVDQIGSPDVDGAELAAANNRRQAEAERLYSDVLRANPDDRTARAGLNALLEANVIVDDYPTEEGFSFYRVENELWSGSVCTLERLVVTDPDELRWACDAWLGLDPDWPVGDLTLVVYRHGTETDRISLAEHFDETMDWSAVTIPPLAGEILPVEHMCYGYTMEAG